MRYVVVGAGAVGGTVGGRLHDAGRDVVLVARGAHAETMRREGLRLAMPDRVLTVRAPVATSVRDIDLTADDVILLATKTQDTVSALDDVATAAAGAGVPVACVQNGVANERMALRRFTDVYGVVVMLPAVLRGPGRIDARGHPYSGLLDIGRVPRGTDVRAERVAADLSAAGFVSQPSPDIMRWKYAKLLRNLGNAMEALCGHDLDDDGMRVVRELDEQLKQEAIACYRAAGIEWASDDEWAAHRADQVMHTPVEGRVEGGGSTWQSLLRGAGSVESDYLNGEIVLLGRSYGVPTPANAVLQRLANRAAHEGAPPGGMSRQALVKAVKDAASEGSGDG